MAGAVVVVSMALGAPADASTVPAGGIEVLPAPGTSLHVPRDGRLNGDGFFVDLTGYRFCYQVGLGSSVRDAAPGQHLLVFGATDGGSAVSAALVVDGRDEPLPSASAGPTQAAYFVASVPDNAKQVALQVSKGDFSQVFSFTDGRRVGVQPAVLYRNDTGSTMTARWGTLADGFLTLFTQKLVLSGIADITTLKAVSALAGEVDVRTKSFTFDNPIFPLRSSQTWSVRRQPRLPVDKLAGGEPWAAILISGAELSRVWLPPLPPK